MHISEISTKLACNKMQRWCIYGFVVKPSNLHFSSITDFSSTAAIAKLTRVSINKKKIIKE
jgi:hypothetical protein